MHKEKSAIVSEVPHDLIELAAKLGVRHPVICEIGSRDALDGIRLCKTFEASECHVFEADPRGVELCKENIAKYGGGLNISLNAVAVADRGSVIAYLPVNTEQSENRDIGFSSMFRINPLYWSKRGAIVQDRIEVPATTLDAYFEGRKNQPDLLWIDVEGAEKLVLSGAEKVLKHVRLIHIEVSFRPMQIGKPLFWEIDAYLKERGFALAGFAGVSRIKAFVVVHKLLPNLPWHWNAIYYHDDPNA